MNHAQLQMYLSAQWILVSIPVKVTYVKQPVCELRHTHTLTHVLTITHILKQQANIKSIQNVFVKMSTLQG